MKVKFTERIIVAGDKHILLVAEAEDGRTTSTLVYRLFFYEFNYRRARKKLLRRLKVENA